jgi:hypothetical protein
MLLLECEEPVPIDSSCGLGLAKRHTFVGSRLAQRIAENTHAREYSFSATA